MIVNKRDSMIVAVAGYALAKTFAPTEVLTQFIIVSAVFVVAASIFCLVSKRKTLK
jgi:hypothetical protein